MEEMNTADASSPDSWDRGLRLAFSKREATTRSTWKQPDASATPLPEPGPAPALKPPAEGALLAEPYKVMGEVGRGGIGIVLQARDLALGREVAVKVLQPRHQANPAAVTRFTREARIAAQLQHPGIVPVYAAGQDELDRPYIAMKLLRGSTLEELLDKRKDPKEGRAGHIRIFEQVCQTMAYAHSRGVIHRDLKPGNVMVGAFGEVQIIDWGFARVLGTPATLEDSKTLSLIDQALAPNESSALSVAGVPIGTPAYMAPEQALGDLKALDERTDVFCLGSILVEILTGAPPYDASGVREVMEAAAKGDLRPVYARLDRSGAEIELIALAKDCLRASKNDRPKNAGAVAERVSAFLAAVGERALQAEINVERERTRARDERRKKQLVLALAAAVVLAGAGIGWLAWSGAQKRQQVEQDIRLILGEAQSRAAREEWPAAEERALHAEAALKGADVSAALTTSVEEFLAQARAKKAEFEVMQFIYGLREHPNSPPHEMDRRYAENFKKIGIDIDAMPAAEIGRSIRARGRATAELLTLALDDWTMRFKPGRGRPGPAGREGERPPPRGPEEQDRPRQSPERRRKVLEAALATDEHPWRNRLRRAMLDEDRDAVEELSRTIESKRPPAPSLIMLGQAMASTGRRDAGLAVMQAAYRLYPEDFWVSFMIAHENIPFPGERDERKTELSERHARLAVSLGPKNPHAHALLAAVLFARAKPGDREEALQRVRSAALDDGPFGETMKLVLRAADGDAPSREEARRMLEDREHPPLIRSLLEAVR